MGPALAPLEGSIDVANDLTDVSHLKSLLQSQGSLVFKLGDEIHQFLAQPVSTAIMAHPVSIGLSAPGTWATASGIGFSLKASARCTLSISRQSLRFAVAMDIDSPALTDVFIGPEDGSVWVNLALDFDIKGGVTGAGAVGAIGIAGRASGSASASVMYCHRVDGATRTFDAIKSAFSTFVFPFQPDCALRMSPGDIAKVNFDATLGFGVQVSYGLGSFKFSAPGVDTALQSTMIGQVLKVPVLDVEAGVKGSVRYTHTNRFGAIVSKRDSGNATLYLFRASADEMALSAAVSVGVSVTEVEVDLPPQALTQMVSQVAGAAGAQVAPLAGSLKDSLIARTNSFIGKAHGDVGLSASLERQTNRALLYEFAVDLSQAELTQQSWAQLSAGDVLAATKLGGLKLLPGSGVTNQLKRSVSIGLHFFNLFSAKDVETFFQRSTTEVGPDGSIRFLFDIGKESEQDTKKAMRRTRIHFVASATEENAATVDKASVDLYIEFSEQGDAKDARRISATLGAVPAEKIADVQDAIEAFAAAGGPGRVNVITILKPSAYRRVACSPYAGAKHDIPPADQTDDHANWNAFHDAAVSILGYQFLQGLTYAKWAQYNTICTGANVADRRSPGNTLSSSLDSQFWGSLQNVKGQAGFFLQSSAQFMNLCDDLNALAGLAGAVNTAAAWQRLLDELTFMVVRDASSDWSKPAASAIFGRFGGGGVQTNVVQALDLTCTVTLS